MFIGRQTLVSLRWWYEMTINCRYGITVSWALIHINVNPILTNEI